MRKKVLWLSSFLMALLFASSAVAETYKFEKGDTLWSVARANSTTVKKLRELNKKLANVDVRNISVGFEIEIPTKGKSVTPAITKVSDKKGKPAVKAMVPATTDVKSVKARTARKTVEKLMPVDIYIPGKVGIRQGVYSTENIGRAPTKMNLEKAFSKLLLSERAKAILKVLVAENRGVDGFIEPGDQFLMTYGSNGIIDATLKHHSDLAATQYLFELDGIIYDIRLIWYCKNWVRYQEKRKIISPPPKVITTQSPPTVVSTQPPPYMAGPPIVTQGPKVSSKDRDTWDLYFGGGNYENRIDPGNNNGGYGWSKGRIRPSYFDVEENYLGIKSYGLGFVGFISGGEGVAVRYFDYEWYQVAAGGTAKVYAKNSDYDFDAMIFRLLNEGTWMGTGGNKQIDYGLLLSAHGNIYNSDPKSLFLPKWEWNIEGRFPFTTKVERGEEVNNRVIEGNFTQWLYRFEFDKENSFAISPGLNLGGGYEWAAEDGGFIKAGGAFELSSRKNVLGALSPYNLKWQGGEIQRHPISAYVSADGIYNAIKASQVTSISEEELRGLDQVGGSKLLKNPADYL